MELELGRMCLLYNNLDSKAFFTSSMLMFGTLVPSPSMQIIPKGVGRGLDWKRGLNQPMIPGHDTLLLTWVELRDIPGTLFVFKYPPSSVLKQTTITTANHGSI